MGLATLGYLKRFAVAKYNELTDINEREIFTYAFKLGAKLILAVMSDVS